MTKIKRFLFTMAAVCFLFLCTPACTDDDSVTRRSGSGIQNSIIKGKWDAQSASIREYADAKLEYEYTETFINGEYFYFHSDNTFVTGDDNSVLNEGTYKIISNSKMIFTYGNEGYEKDEEWSISLTSNSLKMIYEEEEEAIDGTTYKRVVEITATR
jgi:hypothetical protein